MQRDETLDELRERILSSDLLESHTASTRDASSDTKKDSCSAKYFLSPHEIWAKRAEEIKLSVYNDTVLYSDPRTGYVKV